MSQETPFIHIQNVQKSFTVNNKKMPAIEPTSLTIEKNEVVSIIGPSGCGKSTLLRMIAGLEIADSGLIEVDGKTVVGPSVDRGMAFQDSRLFPWLTIQDNIAFGLPKDVDKNTANQLVKEHLALVKLEQFANAYPHQLSGGMKQRASIARALINKPSVLLLDEPFGALDAMTKIHMQEEVMQIWEQEKITMILVTHDITEAIYMADHVVILSGRPGSINEIISIDLPRPRQRNSFEFVQLQEKIYSNFFA